MEGWIKLHRKLQDNPLWTCEPFTRGQAWVDLILLANHKDSFFYVRGIKINVNRGQLAWSEVKLSDRWKWSRSKLRKFLNDLEEERQIKQHKGNVIQIVTLKNYDEYQQKEPQTEQQKDRRSTTEVPQKDIYKKDKKDKKDKNENKIKYSEFVSMTEIEYNKLIEDHKEINVKTFISILDNYKGSSGKTYKSDYRAILSWVIDKVKSDNKYKSKVKLSV